MPNWVSNIVRGGCPKALRQLRDFSLIIPEHPSMSLFPDWASQHAVQLFQEGKNWQEVATDASFLAHLAREQEDTPTKCRLTPERAARRYCLYYKLHGYVDWYDWCCEHWGTKWNAHQDSHECGEVWFETAWSHPYPVIAALSRQFPAEVFSVSYADEDIGNNTGEYDIRNGKLLCGGEIADGSREAFEIAFFHWGGDEDYELVDGEYRYLCDDAAGDGASSFIA